jgi:hypothetical protein
VTIEKFKSPSERMVNAMVRSETNRLTVSDGMKISGLSYDDVHKDLMLLSTITGGTIEVDEEGELIYSFPNGFNKILTQKNLGTRLKKVRKALGPPLMYMTRVSFGLMLLTSLAIIMMALASAQSSSRSSSNSKGSNDDDGDRRSSRRGGGLTINSYTMNIGRGPNIFDFMYYRPYGYYYYHHPGSSSGGRGGVSMMESFFSFVFGDGNPNHGFNERRLQRVAELIRRNDGLVVAEELAPYLDPPQAPLDATALQRLKVQIASQGGGGERERERERVRRAQRQQQLELAVPTTAATTTVVQESWALPAVVQFGGVPEVTEQGNIYYRFDLLKQDLSASAFDSSVGGGIGGGIGGGSMATEAAAEWAEEVEVPFSRASAAQQLLAGGLGLVNLGGVAWLGTALRRTVSVTLSRDVAALRALYPFLLGYALLYVALPALRAVDNTQRNTAIKRNNANRRLWAEYVSSNSNNRSSSSSSSSSSSGVGGGDDGFAAKLADVRASHSRRQQQLGGSTEPPRKKIVYTTAVEESDDV